MVTFGNNSVLARWFGAAALVIAMLALGGCGDMYGRSDFSGFVMGKSEQEVVKMVGKADTVDDSNPARVTWTYKGRTFDFEQQNKRDAKALVIFQRDSADGKLKVTEVKFES
ncbi:MAG: hypothetical protein A3F74_13295 [Betaproteobacteria bacterium RIFCSPLOWO2_12_FULL_62_58]|nr:MAG: hypothetical protein A3F74_13295 [Betaproteobacteria bacterium RIFCSPLOWO2_12_FULL_62_58]